MEALASLDQVPPWAPPMASNDAARSEVYFIDRSLADAQGLASELPSGVEVHFIERGVDGVEFIAQTLQGRQGVDAVHVLSHGRTGELTLGSASLSAGSMQVTYGDALATIGRVMATDGDILLYGCDFGAGASGQQAVQLLAAMVGADVAASSDDTGSARLGGDWVLEVQQGVVQTQTVRADAWDHLMVPPIVSTTDTTLVNGSFETTGGWTAEIGPVERRNDTLFGYGPFEGNFQIEVEGDPGSSYVEQTVSNLTPGETYELTWVGRTRENVDYVGTGVDIGTMTVTGARGGTAALDFETTRGSWTQFRMTFVADTATATIRITSRGNTAGSDALDRAGLAIDAVRLVGGVYAASFTENGTAVAVASANTTVLDDDSTTMASATITLTNAQAGDVLAFGTLPGGITGAVDTSVAGQIVVRLTGNASEANYATALRAVRFSNTLEDPSTTARNLTITVNDGTADSAPARTTISVVAVNDAPVLANTDLTFVASGNSGPPSGPAGSLVSTLLGGASDPDLADPRGIAITAANTTRGSWWYSIDGGATWLDLGPVSAGSARLLAANDQTRLYFQPTAAFTGEVANALTFRAWDMTDGAANGATGSTGTNGGTAAFSRATETVILDVQSLAPQIDLDSTTDGRDFSGDFDQGGSPITHLATLTDLDTPNLASLVVTLADPEPEDVLSLVGNFAGITYKYNSTTGVLMIGGEAPLATYQDVLNAIRFSTTSGSTEARTITVYATSTHSLLASNVAAVVLRPLDTDDDGVINVVDIDDDNDGIIDLNEMEAGADGGVNYSYWRITPRGSPYHDSVPLNGPAPSFPDLDRYGLPDNFSLPELTGTADGLIKPAGTESGEVDAIRYEGYFAFPPELIGKDVQLRLDPSGGTLSSGAWVVSTDSDPANWIDPVSVVTGEPLLDMGNTLGYVNSDTGWTGPPVGYTDHPVHADGTRLDVSRGGNPQHFVATVKAAQGGNYFTYYMVDPTAAWNPHAFQYSTDGGATWRNMPSAFMSSNPAAKDIDTDLDGVVDRLDIDSDNDGIPGNVEAQTTAGYLPPTGKGAAMVDVDRDGLDDRYDANTADITPEASLGLTPVDTDGDGTADYRDADSDADGRPDIAERGDGQPTSLTSSTDTDHDGLFDIFEHGTVDDGYDVHDRVLTTTGSGLATAHVAFNLGDSDADTPIDGRGAVPLEADLDYRDARAAPIIDLNSTAAPDDDLRGHGALFSGPAPVSIADPDADVTDLGDEDIDRMTIAVADILDGDNEVLNVGGFDFLLGTDSTQTVTIDGVDLLIAYTQAAGFVVRNAAGGVIPNAALDTLVRGMTYSNALVVPTGGRRTFTFVVTDTEGASSGPAVSTVEVPPNLPPVAIDDVGLSFEGQPTLGNVLVNDSDAEGPVVVTSFTIPGDPTVYSPGATATMPGIGTLTISSTGAYIFVPLPDYFGPVPVVDYTIEDTAGLTAAATLTLGPVEPAQDPPVPEDPGIPGQSFDPNTGTYRARTQEDVPFNGQVVGSDADGDTLTYTIASPPAHGTVTMDPATGTYVYTPVPDYYGDDVFTVIIDDGTGNQVEVTVAMAVTTVPDIADDQATTPEDTPVVIVPLANDTFEGTQPRITALNDQPVSVGGSIAIPNGRVTLNADGTLTYTPNRNFHGVDSFVYTVSSGGRIERATVDVTVLDVNDPPTLTDPGVPGQSFDPATGTYTAGTMEDVNFDGRVAGLDEDGDTLTYTVDTPPAHGTVTLDPATGTYRYTPNPDFYGVDTFTVVVSDGMGGLVTARVNMNVTPVPDVADDDAETLPTESVTIRVFDNDTFEGPAPLITAIDGQPIAVGQTVAVAHGTVTLNADGTLLFTPDGNFTDVASFTYTVTSGGVTETATVRVRVNAPPGDFPFVFEPEPSPYEHRFPDPWALDDADALEADPPVVRAVNGQASLDGTRSLIGASGAVLQAANGVDSLGGLNTLTARGIVVAAVNDLAPLDGLETRFRGRDAWGRAGLAGGGGVEPDLIASLHLGSGAQLELTQHGERVWIHVGGSARELRVTAADGGRLPAWVSADRRGFVAIDRPANVDSLRLRLTVVPERGRTRTHTIEIDFNAGQMREVSGRQPTGERRERHGSTSGLQGGDASAEAFAVQLQRAARGPSSVDEALLEALNLG